jgi:glycosyltransferase involved in cell wall biosynthesis
MVRESGLSERVRFVGRIAATEVADFMRAIDIAVVCPLSIKFLQYNASGLPTIYPITEDFRWLGPLGAGYPADAAIDSDSGMTGMLEKLCEDASLRKEIGARSRALAVQRYSWDGIVERMEELFQGSVIAHGK